MARPQAPPLHIRRWQAGEWLQADDQVAAEEPLQLLLNGEPLSIVMRTPGNDLELAVGLLYSERVLTSTANVERLNLSAEAAIEADRKAPFPVDATLIEANTVDIRLLEGAPGRRPSRSFLASSACGVCGQTTAEDLAQELPPLAPGPEFDPVVLTGLPDKLRAGQGVFDRTGGLHAAGAFDQSGHRLLIREDVGRHNAVDKVVGRLLLEGALPARQMVLAVSGRAGYELVQKAVTAGIPALVAVGAPSSLAVQVARRFGLTLVGFLREQRFNVYSGWERLDTAIDLNPSGD
jgi:FdhD protein